MSEFILNKGNLERTNEKPDYTLKHASDLLSHVTNLIPLVSGVSGNRVLLGDKSFLQAITLPGRETPWVSSTSSLDNPGFNHEYSHLVSVKAPHAGEVTHVKADKITLSNNGKSTDVHLFSNYTSGKKNFIDQNPVVKVGDKVAKGALLATSNFSDKEGNLAVGVNLNTAIMPYRGHNFEDGYVVSQAGADKLKGQQIMSFTMEKIMGIETNKSRFVSLFPNKFTNSQLANIDEDGIAKKGTVLHHGDPVILACSPKSLKSTDIQLGKLTKVLKNAFNDQSETWHYSSEGTVVDVAKAGKIITVNVKADRNMSVGDKLCMTPDHEVLTSTGWKNITALSLEDKICSLNPENDEIEYVSPIAFPEYDYTGKMYNLETTQVSMCVTDNHKLYAQRREGGRKLHDYVGNYKLTPASELYGKRYKLKKDGNWTGKSPESIFFKSVAHRNTDKKQTEEVYYPSSVFCGILGMFLSEGSVVNDIPSGSYGLDIAQVKIPNRKKLIDYFSNNSISFSVGKRSVRIYKKALLEYFSQFGKCYNKFIPNDVFEFEKKDLVTLFDWMVWGDGSIDKKGVIKYYTSSKQLADDFQRLCLHIGYSCIIIPRTIEEQNKCLSIIDGRLVIATCINYMCIVTRRKNEPEINHGHSNTQNGQSEEWIDYSGKVHCVTLEKNHVFYVRRNGKVHWTGNSSAFGIKGVCTKILSDVETPHDLSGKPIDIFLNSMSITSRVSPALVSVLATGKVAQHLGKPIDLPAFAKTSVVQDAKDLLAKHGISESDEIDDPVTGKKVKVTVGPLYYSRLGHIGEDKLTERGEGSGYDINAQPNKGGSDSSSKKQGHQLTMALLSHGARSFLEDSTTVRGVRNDEYWRRFKLGQPLPAPQVPFIFHKFIDSLKGSGINVVENNGMYRLLPQTDKDVEKLSHGKILVPDTFRVRKNDLIPEKGGLFDPTIVGITGDKFNHIELNMKVPNPISEDYLRKLLGLKKDDYYKAITDGTLEKKLTDINIDDKIKEYKEYLKGGNKTKRNVAVGSLQFLNTLKEHGLHPKDLMLSKIPVIPAKFRPASATPTNIISADVNGLYKDLMLNNEAIESVDVLPDEESKHSLKLDQYKAVKAIYGFDDPINMKNKQKGLKGLLSSVLGLHGGSGKESMFQAKVVNHPVDLVTRGVLSGDPGLGIDQISLPHESIWKIYSPFATRRLVQKGIPATQAHEYVKHQHPLAWKETLEELKDRPVVLTRDPILHRMSSMGAYVRPNADPHDATVKLNPLLYKALGADTDGDANFSSVILVVNKEKWLTLSADFDICSVVQLEITQNMKAKLGIKVNEEVHLINLEDFPHGPELFKRNHITFYSVPEDVKVVAWDEKTNKPVIADVSCFSKHEGIEVEVVSLASRRQILTDNDPRAIYGINPDTLEYERSTPSDAKRLLIPYVRRSDVYSYKGMTKLNFEKYGENGHASKLKQEVELDFNAGYVIGSLIGDGWATYQTSEKIRGMAINLASSYDEIINAFKTAMDASFLLEPGHYVYNWLTAGKLGNSTGSGRLTLNCSPLATWFGENCGSGCRNKKIPSFSLGAPKEFRLGLLSGLWDSDGSMFFSHAKKKPQFMCTYTTLSIRLAHEIVQLLRTMGIESAINTHMKQVTGKAIGEKQPVYSINVSTIDLKKFGKFNLFHPERAAAQEEFFKTPVDEVNVGSYHNGKYLPLPYTLALELRNKLGTGSLYYYDLSKKIKANQGYLTRPQAKKIIGWLKDNNKVIEHPLYDKWVGMVEDVDLIFDIVVSVEKTGIKETGYDLTVPGYETFMAFDGTILSNTLNFHVPAGEKAKQDVITKMLPSKNVLSIKDFNPIFFPSNEAALGNFHASYENNKNKAIKFKTEEEMTQAFNRGDISVGDQVEIG